MTGMLVCPGLGILLTGELGCGTGHECCGTACIFAVVGKISSSFPGRSSLVCVAE